MFGWRKRHPVTRIIDEYMEKAETCLVAFHEGFAIYLDEGLCPAFNEAVERVDHLETDCDAIRRRVEAAMYEKALIPESRTDILHLLEKLDKVPNRAERVMYDIYDEKFAVPPHLRESFREMIRHNRECFESLAQAVRSLFTDAEKVQAHVVEVDTKETNSDALKRLIVRAVFASNEIQPLEKILLRDLAVNLSHVSDASENAADWLTIIVVKRLV